VSIFPNKAACLRLVSAILMELSDEWEGGKVYLSFENGTPSSFACNLTDLRNNLTEFTERPLHYRWF
jgi:hypothetical protein